MSGVTAADRVRDRERWWEIHDRDEYVCPDCGATADHPEFKRWEVHHINREPGNVVAVCKRCHYVRHGAEPKNVSIEWWKEAFLEIGDEGSIGDMLVYSPSSMADSEVSAGD